MTDEQKQRVIEAVEAYLADVREHSRSADRREAGEYLVADIDKIFDVSGAWRAFWDARVAGS